MLHLSISCRVRGVSKPWGWRGGKRGGRIAPEARRAWAPQIAYFTKMQLDDGAYEILEDL